MLLSLTWAYVDQADQPQTGKEPWAVWRGRLAWAHEHAKLERIWWRAFWEGYRGVLS